METKENKKHTFLRLHVMYLSIIGIFLLVMIIGYYSLHRVSAHVTSKRNVSGMLMRGMAMAAVTPPSASEQQLQQLSLGASRSVTQKTFNITGGNFYFVPDEITVNKGDQVTFVMTNAGGVHDLVIDALGVKTPVTHTAQAATVTFTAGRTGAFVYYCDIPGHRTKGMWGTLIVQ